MKSKLAKVFEEILREVDANPELRSRIEGVLSPDRSLRESPVPKQPARNRRARGVLDPYGEFENGEPQLREKLSVLTVDQLKDIVSEYALDSSRLALKWKDRERLINLIVGTVRGRIEKGDAFRETT